MPSLQVELFQNQYNRHWGEGDASDKLDELNNKPLLAPLGDPAPSARSLTYPLATHDMQNIKATGAESTSGKAEQEVEATAHAKAMEEEGASSANTCTEAEEEALNACSQFQGQYTLLWGASNASDKLNELNQEPVGEPLADPAPSSRSLSFPLAAHEQQNIKLAAVENNCVCAAANAEHGVEPNASAMAKKEQDASSAEGYAETDDELLYMVSDESSSTQPLSGSSFMAQGHEVDAVAASLQFATPEYLVCMAGESAPELQAMNTSEHVWNDGMYGMMLGVGMWSPAGNHMKGRREVHAERGYPQHALPGGRRKDARHAKQAPDRERKTEDGPFCLTCGNGKRWIAVGPDQEKKGKKHGDEVEKGKHAPGLCAREGHIPDIPPAEAKHIASRSETGSRAVQFALSSQCKLPEDAKRAIAYNFKGAFKECSKCPKANHVVQACFKHLSEESDLIMVMDELLAPDDDEQQTQSREAIVRETAENEYGCRILERMLEYLSEEQVQKYGLLNALLDPNYVVSLCKHRYANYVMQGILSAGTKYQKEQEQLMQTIIEHARALGQPERRQDQGSMPPAGQMGPAVIAAAFKSNVPCDLKRALADTLVGDLEDHQLHSFVSMASADRFGQAAATNALKALTKEIRMKIKIKLTPPDHGPLDAIQNKCMQLLQTSRYGKGLNKYIIEKIGNI
jgi:hypothetical protein